MVPFLVEVVNLLWTDQELVLIKADEVVTIIFIFGSLLVLGDDDGA